MKVFEYDFDKNIYFPDYIDKGESLCFFDIETDGLSHVNNNIILVGLLLYSNSRGKIVQIFCERPDEEKTLITTLSKLLGSVDTIVTYNGASFDIPFVKKKLLKYNLEDIFSSLSHIDLYKKVRSYRDELELKDCKLKTVEQKLGIYRDDTISGRESVLLYKKYLSTPSFSIRKTILKHNYDDIYHLPDIFKIEKLLDMNDTISLQSSFGIIKISVGKNDLRLKKNNLDIKCASPALDSSDILAYEDAYSISWNKSLGAISISLNTQAGALNDGSKVSYVCVCDLNLPKEFSRDSFLIVANEGIIQRDRVLYLVSLILEKWL